MQGPLAAFVNQAADTFDGNGDSFRQALRELSQTAGRLGDSRTDLFGTIRNLQVLVDALSNSNEQIVQFSNHVASVSQVLADSSTDLDNTLGTLNQALGDVKGFLEREQRGADRPGRQAGRLHPDPDRSQRRHRADPAHHAQRAGELLQHLQPGPGHGRRSAVAAELRQPRAVHLRWHVRRRRLAGQLQASRDLPPADGPGVQAHHDELPADPVPPDQQHHRVQGPDHLRHPGDRGQGADPGAVPAMADRARCHAAGDAAGCRPDLADGSADAGRARPGSRRPRRPRRTPAVRRRRLPMPNTPAPAALSPAASGGWCPQPAEGAGG